MADDVIECATRGDAILVVGTGLLVRKIKIDTYILKAVSKTFKAMFGHQWSDDQNLSYSTPKEISFPDDDSEAMELVCRILHHRYYPDLRSVDAIQLLNLARLADKYFLQEAMAFTGDSLIRKITTNDPQTLMYLLGVAFVFRNTELKETLFKKLVIGHAQDYSRLMSSDTPRELLDLKDALTINRQRFHDQYNLLLFDIFTDFPRDYIPPCDCLSAYHGALYVYLNDNGLIPRQDDLDLESVHLRVQRLQKFPAPFANQYEHSGYGGRHKLCYATPLDLYATMQTKVAELLLSMDSMKVL